MDEKTSAHEAMLYRARKDGSCDCFLCAHRCHIAQGKRGVCGVRENCAGRLVSLVYGKLIAVHVDPIEKKPLYHFLPGTQSLSLATVGCNFRCDYCQNWSISQAREARITGAETTPEETVQSALSAGCPSISYTYTEPTVFFEYAYDCASLAQARGIKNCFVTNGYQSPECIEKMAGLIDAANVDLKSFSETFYRERCGARLEPVLDSIRRMHEARIHLEITTLLIPGFNDDPDELRELAAFLASVSVNIPWHVSRYHPDYHFDQADATSADAIFAALEIGESAGLRFLYAGNLPAGEYENTRCPACGTTVIERSGFQATPVALEGAACAECSCPLPLVV